MVISGDLLPWSDAKIHVTKIPAAKQWAGKQNSWRNPLTHNYQITKKYNYSHLPITILSFFFLLFFFILKKQFYRKKNIRSVAIYSCFFSGYDCNIIRMKPWWCERYEGGIVSSCQIIWWFIVAIRLNFLWPTISSSSNTGIVRVVL